MLSMLTAEQTKGELARVRSTHPTEVRSTQPIVDKTHNAIYSLWVCSTEDVYSMCWGLTIPCRPYMTTLLVMSAKAFAIHSSSLWQQESCIYCWSCCPTPSAPWQFTDQSPVNPEDSETRSIMPIKKIHELRASRWPGLDLPVVLVSIIVARCLTILLRRHGCQRTQLGYLVVYTIAMQHPFSQSVLCSSTSLCEPSKNLSVCVKNLSLRWMVK